jgi:Tfp pilus assembly protein PilO
MIGNMSRREQLLIGGGALAALLVMGWAFVVQPIRERFRAAAELTPVREQMLGRRLELVARKGAIAHELETTNAQIQAVADRFLSTATPAVAASELQKLAKEIAVKASTEIRSERILPPVERGDLVEIPIEIAVSAEIRQLVELLTRLEQAPKIITVQDLKVRVVNVTQPKELLATMTLSGFILPSKPKA